MSLLFQLFGNHDCPMDFRFALFVQTDIPYSWKEEQAEKYSKYYYNLWKEATFDEMCKLKKSYS